MPVLEHLLGSQVGCYTQGQLRGPSSEHEAPHSPEDLQTVLQHSTTVRRSALRGPSTSSDSKHRRHVTPIVKNDMDRGSYRRARSVQ